jgi:prepilin-type N-terminal cleavage/methylation domain-containing protein
LKRTQGGFTLIELMIVVAIIAVLAAILIPNFLHARAESQTTACEGNVKQIATSLEEHAVDTGGKYPASGLVTPALFGGAPYMASTPTDPVNGTQYQFENPAAQPVCNAGGGGASYDIIDSGGHDPTVAIANAAKGATFVIYCSGSGINGK